MLTLWAIARSPLILGANLTKLDDWTTQLLTNRSVLDVDQFGHDQRQVAREGDHVIWISKGRPGTLYLALFNLSDNTATINHSYAFYGLPGSSYKSRELWSQTGNAASATVHVVLPPHGCQLLELTKP